MTSVRTDQGFRATDSEQQGKPGMPNVPALTITVNDNTTAITEGTAEGFERRVRATQQRDRSAQELLCEDTYVLEDLEARYKRHYRSHKSKESGVVDEDTLIVLKRNTWSSARDCSVASGLRAVKSACLGRRVQAQYPDSTRAETALNDAAQAEARSIAWDDKQWLIWTELSQRQGFEPGERPPRKSLADRCRSEERRREIWREIEASGRSQ